MAEAWTVLGTVARSAPATDVDVFEEAPVGMALTDAAGRFRSVNAAFGRLLGRRPADLVGTPIASLSRRDDVAGAQAVMYDLLDRVAETARFEDRYLRPDGSVVWVDMSIRSLPVPAVLCPAFWPKGSTSRCANRPSWPPTATGTSWKRHSAWPGSGASSTTRKRACSAPLTSCAASWG